MLQITLPLTGIESPTYSTPEHETPAARIAEHGGNYLADAEILSLVLSRNLSQDRALETARNILHEIEGDLAALARYSIAELEKLSGIGAASARTIAAAVSLGQRLTRPAVDRPKLQAPAEVADLMRPKFLGKEQEEFHALLLNTKHALIRDEVITIGLLDRSHVHAREVFRRAIRESCGRIILVHNHPSGDPTPSQQDIASTKKLIEAGKIIGIEVLDHVIIGHKTTRRTVDFLSFRQENLFS